MLGRITVRIASVFVVLACCRSFSFGPLPTTRIRQHAHRHARVVAVSTDTGLRAEDEGKNGNDEHTSCYDTTNIEDGDAGASNPDIGGKKAADDLAFFDEATIFVRAGSGGQGASTYKKGLKNSSDGMPDGGNGGLGGDVVLVADPSLNTLAGLNLVGWRPNSFGGSGASYRRADATRSLQTNRVKSFRAGTGHDGGRQFDNGGHGEAVEIRVPPGTVVRHEVEVQDEETRVVGVESVELGVLTPEETPTLVVARGGRGGDGSGVTKKSAAKGRARRRQPPGAGQRRKLKLTLKIVADVALVGVPNAGKSTFLASVTRATPKIANVSVV